MGEEGDFPQAPPATFFSKPVYNRRAGSHIIFVKSKRPLYDNLPPSVRKLREAAAKKRRAQDRREFKERQAANG